MTNVIEFQKKDKSITGQAKCMDCKHEWTAVVPKDSVDSILEWLECPSCSLLKGRLIHPFMVNKPHWMCGCGNDLFQVTEDCTYCPNCGQEQVFP